MKITHIALKECKPFPRHSTGQQAAIQLGRPRPPPRLRPYLRSARDGYSPRSLRSETVIPPRSQAGPRPEHYQLQFMIKADACSATKKQTNSCQSHAIAARASNQDTNNRGAGKGPRARHEEKNLLFFRSFRASRGGQTGSARLGAQGSTAPLNGRIRERSRYPGVKRLPGR